MDAEVRQRLPVSKPAVQKFDMERVELKKLNNVEVKVSNIFAYFEKLSDYIDINGLGKPLEYWPG